MKNVDIIRAWKDKSYRDSLSEEQLAQLKASPVGELSNLEQELVAGGDEPFTYQHAHTCRGKYSDYCGVVR